MTTRNGRIKKLLEKPYARMLIPAGDGKYAAEVLEFPGCFAEGDDPTDAMKNLDAAAESWIEAALEQNQEIPEPLASYGYSGKLNLRLPKSIHKQAARFAQREDVSLNHFLTSAIAARVGAEEMYDRLVERIESRWVAVTQTLQVPQVIRIFSITTCSIPEFSSDWTALPKPVAGSGMYPFTFSVAPSGPAVLDAPVRQMQVHGDIPNG